MGNQMPGVGFVGLGGSGNGATGPTGISSNITGPTGPITTGPTGPNIANNLPQVIEQVNIKGNCTGAQVVDLTLGNMVTATLTGPGTWTFQNVASPGYASTVTLILTNAGANITWSPTPKWVGGIQPNFSETGVDVLVMTTVDGGTTWYASTAINLS